MVRVSGQLERFGKMSDVTLPWGLGWMGPYIGTLQSQARVNGDSEGVGDLFVFVFCSYQYPHIYS